MEETAAGNHHCFGLWVAGKRLLLLALWLFYYFLLFFSSWPALVLWTARFYYFYRYNCNLWLQWSWNYRAAAESRLACVQILCTAGANPMVVDDEGCVSTLIDTYNLLMTKISDILSLRFLFIYNCIASRGYLLVSFPQNA